MDKEETSQGPGIALLLVGGLAVLVLLFGGAFAIYVMKRQRAMAEERAVMDERMRARQVAEERARQEEASREAKPLQGPAAPYTSQRIEDATQRQADKIKQQTGEKVPK